jgi:hypothetical protein
VPFIGSGIVVDPHRGAEGEPAVSAAREFYVCSVRVTGRSHAGQRVNVVVSWPAGTVNPQELLADESARIYVSANYAPTHVHGRDLIESRRSRQVRITRADAPKSAPAIIAANEEVMVRGHIECSPSGGVGNANGAAPGDPAIGRAIKQSAAASGCGAPGLILVSVSLAADPINRVPLLVASERASVIQWLARPGLAAIGRAPDVVAKRL